MDKVSRVSTTAISNNQDLNRKERMSPAVGAHPFFKPYLS